jgi:hypothetical protein
VGLNGKQAVTDAQGNTEIFASVGYKELTVTKAYYEDHAERILLPLLSDPGQHIVELRATGRTVPVTVVHNITRKPLPGITLKAADSEVQTDEEGKAIIVVPAGEAEVAVTLSGDNFNDTEATLQVTVDEIPENTFGLTPTGKIYFLSNQSGNIDVVKTNLDGTGRAVILKGTGHENRHNTALLASRDWRYLALHSQRESDEKSKLYLIDTSDDSVVVMDEGDASFGLVGWSGHHFVYRVDRSNVQQWQKKRQALKSYNAQTNRIITLDETTAEGDQGNYYAEILQSGEAYVLDDEIVYAKSLNGSYPAQLEGKKARLMRIKPDGTGQRTIQSYTPATDDFVHFSYYITLRAYGPNELYFTVDGRPDLYEYEDGRISTVADKTPEAIYNESYPTYLVSPDGKRTFWSETRDGREAMFVGDKDGENERQIAVLAEHNSYGWYTDDYLLISKNGSELYLMSVEPQEGDPHLFKVSDYYRPGGNSFQGYGYGYGGL